MNLSLSSFTRSTLALGALCGTLLFATPAPAAPTFEDLRLGSETRGQAAVNALGSRLPTVASQYGMSAERLRNILLKDSSSRLDARGRLFYVEAMPSGVEQAGASGSPAVAEAAPYDLSQTFLLQSKPGSARVLYLDFNGHSTSGTAWNSGAAINAQAFDTDGSPGSFSAAEQEAIQKVWQRVAEDYAPFDVNVTTADPGIDAIRRTSSTDSQYGSRVVITRNTFYNCSCGGVAYVGTFNYTSSSTPDYYQPAWVFFDALGNGFEKYVAEAASHEAGHNLGLQHDGRTSPAEGYYAGHGSGDTGWAPIMGVGYNRNLSQWSKGEYVSANNAQDDVAVLPQYGLLLRADDVGNSTTGASNLGGSASNGSVIVDRVGIIEQRTDADVFAFFAGPGTMQLDVTPAALGPNLDVEAQLLDSNGVTIATSNPTDTLGATISANLSGGSYYLRVDGVGKGDLTTGYSDYGSLGQYRVTGSYADTGAAPPVASFTATPTSGTAPVLASFDASLSTDSDGSIVSYAWSFGDGSTASGMSVQHSYGSAGTFIATLTVTDTQGLTGTASASITVNSALQVIYVRSISVTSSGNSKGGYQCTAAVTIQNSANANVSGATVSGNWSGTVVGSVSGITGSTGVASLKSAKTKQRGTCTFSVGNVSASGSTYSPSRNLITTGSKTY